MTDTKNDLSLVSILDRRNTGGRQKTDELLRSIYPELRQIAARQMRSERANHTLQATALVGEAFVRLSAVNVEIKDEVHLKALLALAMRRVLLDHARAKNADKRGGKLSVVIFDEERTPDTTDNVEFEVLNEALYELQQFDERASNAVCLHYFGGMTYGEISKLLSVSEATVHKDLRMAKAWLSTQVSR